MTDRTRARIANLLLVLTVAVLIASIAGRIFITPRPAWTHDILFAGLVLAAASGMVKRNTRKRTEPDAPTTGD